MGRLCKCPSYQSTNDNGFLVAVVVGVAVVAVLTATDSVDGAFVANARVRMAPNRSIMACDDDVAAVVVETTDDDVRAVQRSAEKANAADVRAPGANRLVKRPA